MWRPLLLFNYLLREYSIFLYDVNLDDFRDVGLLWRGDLFYYLIK